MPTRQRRGFAIIDFETTGFSPRNGDRVVELGAIYLDANLRIDGGLETIIDPQRDVGPTHIHGLSNADVAGAPTFGEVLPSLLQMLDGRVIVGHNVAFDLRFLTAEIARAGVVAPEFVTLDTMKLAKSGVLGTELDNYRLSTVTAHLGLYLPDVLARLELDERPEHSALGDALLTSLVLAEMIDKNSDRSLWNEKLDRAEDTEWPRTEIVEIEGKTRSELPSFAGLKPAPPILAEVPVTESLEETVVEVLTDADEPEIHTVESVAEAVVVRRRSWWRRLVSRES